MNFMMNKPLEIVGLQMGDHGRNCGVHKIACGSSVTIGTKLKLHKITLKLSQAVVNTRIKPVLFIN